MKIKLFRETFWGVHTSKQDNKSLSACTENGASLDTFFGGTGGFMQTYHEHKYCDENSDGGNNNRQQQKSHDSSSGGTRRYNSQERHFCLLLVPVRLVEPGHLFCCGLALAGAVILIVAQGRFLPKIKQHTHHQQKA